MLDFGSVPGVLGTPQIFTNPGRTTWLKPRGATFVYILAIGGGGGGGNGVGNTAGTARAGGGGGAGGATTVGLFPAILLPDVLYVQAGDAGIGNGANATSSFVGHELVGTLAAAESILIKADFGKNGQNGVTGTGGAGGTVGVASIASDQYRMHIGQVISYAGEAGLVGGDAAVGTPTGSQIASNGHMAFGGCGGPGTTSADFSGSGRTNTDTLIWAHRWLPLAAGATVAGNPGMLTSAPYMSFGGTGGGSQNSGAGQRGGFGIWGSGGGGGGGGTSAGIGGDGGHGVVIICAY